jgi:hypothetical protein
MRHTKNRRTLFPLIGMLLVNDYFLHNMFSSLSLFDEEDDDGESLSVGSSSLFVISWNRLCLSSSSSYLCEMMTSNDLLLVCCVCHVFQGKERHQFERRRRKNFFSINQLPWLGSHKWLQQQQLWPVVVVDSPAADADLHPPLLKCNRNIPLILSHSLTRSPVWLSGRRREDLPACGLLAHTHTVAHSLAQRTHDQA